MSIFQINNVVGTCDILIQCSMWFYGVKCDMLATQSNIFVFRIPNQYPYAYIFYRNPTDNYLGDLCHFFKMIIIIINNLILLLCINP